MKIKLYALGDSITYGFPYGPEFSWVRILAQKTGLTIINGGKNGDTTALMLHRLSLAFNYNPSHLLLLGGTNDAYWAQDLRTVTKNIKGICIRCLEHKIYPILGTPTPVGEPQVEGILAEYRAFIQEIAKKEDIPLIPFHKAFLDEDNRFKVELTTDGCHPNFDGYRAMAELALIKLQIPGYPELKF
ncbi:MAG: Acyl-CoA thioesterase 1 [Dehalococcoidia bacterium]|nr:Acyl-CoA thioesterase 1 [Bacillota bacterium]MBT9141699.1 Acyl-CoA thioesterase 1 [Bacillota bacterium]